MWISRIIWFVCLLASGIFVSTYGGRISYTLFYMMLILPAFLFVYNLFVMYAFKYSQSFGKKSLVKGEATPYMLHLNNESFLAFSNLRISFLEDKSHLLTKEDKKHYCLKPGDREEINTMLLPDCRGEYYAGVKAFSVTDPFGIFTLTYPVIQKALITVLPRITDCLYPEFFRDEADEKKNPPLTTREAEQDIPVRTYTSRDPLKEIHWKASAKAGKLMVHTQRPVSHRQFFLLADFSPVDADSVAQSFTEDLLIEHLISIANYCLQHKLELTYYLNKETPQHATIRSQKDFDMLYSESALFSFDGKQSIATCLTQNIPKDSDLVVLVHTLNDTLIQEVLRLSLLGCHLSLILTKTALTPADHDWITLLGASGIPALYFEKEGGVCNER